MNLFDKWVDRIDNGNLTSALCRELRTTIYGKTQDNLRWTVRSSMTRDEAIRLLQMVREQKPTVDEQKAARVLAYLAGRSDLPDGILDGATTVRLVDVFDDHFTAEPRPVWRVETTDGAFEFVSETHKHSVFGVERTDERFRWWRP